jgi:hypothetical protein
MPKPSTPRTNWKQFAADLQRRKLRYKNWEGGIEFATGVPRLTVGRALDGKPISPSAFLALCEFARVHPFRYLIR